MVDIIKEKLSVCNPDALFLDGFDDALIGIGRRTGMLDVAVYDYNKCVNVMIERDGSSHDDAVDYMEYNVTGTYVGENGPIVVELDVCD
tara:strand:+ start:128 stop:394 length:267 start_codon:yes stop_codon:yes gene_type:complete